MKPLAILLIVLWAASAPAQQLSKLLSTNVLAGTNLIPSVIYPNRTNGTRTITVANLFSNVTLRGQTEGPLAVGTNSPAAFVDIVADNSRDGIIRFGTTNSPGLLSLNTNGVLHWPTNTITVAPTLALGGWALWNSNGVGLYVCKNTNGSTVCIPIQ